MVGQFREGYEEFKLWEHPETTRFSRGEAGSGQKNTLGEGGQAKTTRFSNGAIF